MSYDQSSFSLDSLVFERLMIKQQLFEDTKDWRLNYDPQSLLPDPSIISSNMD